MTNIHVGSKQVAPIESDTMRTVNDQHLANNLTIVKDHKSAIKNQTISESLPQTDETPSVNWLDVLGVSLLGLLGLFGFRKRN